MAAGDKCLSLLWVADLMVFTSGFARADYTIEFFERELYRPGPFPDQKLQPAWLRDVKLQGFLVGMVQGK